MQNVSFMVFTNSQEVAQFFSPTLANNAVEEFWAVSLDSQCKVLEAKMIFRGTVSTCPVHPREVFRFAIITNAFAIIGVHNHPYGNPDPSGEDIAITNRLKRVGRLVGIPLIDHVIISNTGHFSFADSHWLRVGRKLKGQITLPH